MALSVSWMEQNMLTTVQTTGQEGAVKTNKQLILLENPKGS